MCTPGACCIHTGSVRTQCSHLTKVWREGTVGQHHPNAISAWHKYFMIRMRCNRTFHFHDVTWSGHTNIEKTARHIWAPLKRWILLCMSLHGPGQPKSPQSLYGSTPRRFLSMALRVLHGSAVLDQKWKVPCWWLVIFLILWAKFWRLPISNIGQSMMMVICWGWCSVPVKYLHSVLFSICMKSISIPSWYPVIAALVHSFVQLNQKIKRCVTPWLISRLIKPGTKWNIMSFGLFFHLQWRGYFVGEPAEIQSFGSTKEIADEGY